MKRKLIFSFITIIFLISLMAANTVYAAEQGLKARYVKFDLTQQELEAELRNGVTPEELFSMVDYDVEIIDDSAFYLEEADLKVKGDEILEIDNPTGDSPSQFGIHWVGTLIPAESGSYKFSCQTDNGFLMKIDDKVVLDYWRDAHSEMIDGETVQLEAGKKYKIEAWYFDIRGGQFYKVWWAKDGGEKTTIPLSVLSTELPEGENPTPSPTPSPTPEQTPSSSPSQTPVQGATSTPAGSPQATQTGNSNSAGTFPTALIIIIVVAVIIVIGAVAFVVIKKKNVNS